MKENSQNEEKDMEKSGLTQDAFLKRYIEGELDKLRIDISSNEYYKNEKFKQLEKEYVFNGINIPKSWWIEKNLIGQERLKEIYGIYAMGIEHEYSEKELKRTEWMKELADRYEYETKIKTKEEFGRTIKDIEQYMFRKKTGESDGTGLVERLKSLGFDIEKFDHPKSEIEKIKLLYFLYCFEFDNKVKIYPFLSNPTLENVDNMIVEDETRNGELMACLKNNLLKEIDWNYIKEVKDRIYDIATQWEKLIFYVRSLELWGVSKDYLETINSDLKWLISDIEESPVVYEDSLLETFYLKLSLHEMVGRESDLLNVSDKYSVEVIEPGGYRLKKFRELWAETISINWKERLEQYETVFCYIEEHRRLLAQCVLGKEDIDSNDYKKFNRAVKGISYFLNFLKDNTNASEIGFISVLLVVSYLQVAVLMDKNEKVENPFYRYTAEDRRTFNSEIWRGREALRKSQLAWKEKVMAQYDANCGKRGLRRCERDIEHQLDSLLLRVYKCNSLREMNNTVQQILPDIMIILTRRDIILERQEKLLVTLNNGQYRLKIEDESLWRYILGTLEEYQFIMFSDYIRKGIDDAAARSENILSTFNYEISEDISMGIKLKGYLELGIVPKEKEVSIEYWEMNIME